MSVLEESDTSSGHLCLLCCKEQTQTLVATIEPFSNSVAILRPQPVVQFGGISLKFGLRQHTQEECLGTRVSWHGDFPASYLLVQALRTFEDE